MTSLFAVIPIFVVIPILYRKYVYFVVQVVYSKTIYQLEKKPSKLNEKFIELVSTHSWSSACCQYVVGKSGFASFPIADCFLSSWIKI